jgi:leucyl-tRNA synthetase
MKKYEPKVIEPKWQKIWQETNLYTADLESDKPKYFGMDMFNYPSALGLHIGHAFSFTISDVLSRYHRQKGYNTFLPVGWDSFGLPAENYAIKVGRRPQDTTKEAIENYSKNYRAMGFSRDWSREISTCEPEYYRWNQWLFLKLHEHGLAYQSSALQWWCDNCQTVLANEQVTGDNKCWRHETAEYPEIYKKEIKQWFFKVTEYADELLNAIDDLDWTESTKLAQKNWIGRSEGAEIKFKIQDSAEEITVFTTRADTLFGATFIVLAPEHKLALSLATADRSAEIDDYIKQSSRKTEVERQAAKEKTGVFTGAYAINPINDEAVPIYVADYVLGGYGTGAIMAVPAHDERDREFAVKFSLPIKQVVATTFIDTTNPHVEDKELISRNVITAIVKHPNEDKYLIAKPKGGSNWSPLMGGIDEGETAVETAKRELLEETGYKDIASIKIVGDIFASEFFAKHKDVNRIAYCQPILIELSSLEQDLSLAADLDEQEVEWVTREEYVKRSSAGGMMEVLEACEGQPMPIATEGRMINSGKFNGLSSSESRDKIVADLEKKGLAKLKVNYKMRDWSVSRQRYWGTPIPVIHCEDCGSVMVPEEDLPVVLPDLDNFQPSEDGGAPLSRATDWINTTCPKCGGPAKREVETMDTFVDSSWYMFRYLSPNYTKGPFDPELAKHWFPVDFYDGADHATMHLLYSRFITRFFYKLGMSPTPEPFKKFLFHGKVTAHDGTMFSKSKGNGVDPLEVINSGYGADSLRLYEMFAARLDLWIRWNPEGVPAMYRFLNRLWNFVQEYLESSEAKLNDLEVKKLLFIANKTSKKVSHDIEKCLLNTAIASVMAALNDLTKLKSEIAFGKNGAWTEAIETVLMCIAPFAPHITDELWQQLGHSDSINKNHWPELDENYLQEDEITIALMVNGKLRAELKLNKDADKAEMEKAALANPRIQEFLNAKEPKKVIVVPGKLVNFVV